VAFKLIVSSVQDLTGSGLKPGRKTPLSRERPRVGRDDLRHGITFVAGCRDLLLTLGFFCRDLP